MINKIKFIILSLIIITLNTCSDSKITEPEETIIYPIVKATTNGNTWRLISSLPTLVEKHHIRLTDISCDNVGNIYVATSGGGIYKIKTTDSTISQITKGLIPTAISNFSVYYVGTILYNNNRVIAGSTDLQEKAGIYTLDDDSFIPRILWNKYSNVVSLYKNPNGEIFAGCYYDILKSRDNGNSWLSLTENTEDGFGYFYSFSFDKYGNIYAATRRGVYYSDSHKNQFKSIGLTNETILGIDINSQEWICVSTESGKMFMSKDHGSSWQQLKNYPSKQAQCIYINKNDYIIVGTEDGIYRSKDHGDNWEFVGLKNKWILRIIADSNGNLIAGTYMSEIYYSSQ